MEFSDFFDSDYVKAFSLFVAIGSVLGVVLQVHGYYDLKRLTAINSSGEGILKLLEGEVEKSRIRYILVSKTLKAIKISHGLLVLFVACGLIWWLSISTLSILEVLSLEKNQVIEIEEFWMGVYYCSGWLAVFLGIIYLLNYLGIYWIYND